MNDLIIGRVHFYEQTTYERSSTSRPRITPPSNNLQEKKKKKNEEKEREKEERAEEEGKKRKRGREGGPGHVHSKKPSKYGEQPF